MPKPKDTLWPMKDHTRIKHVILKRYLDAWIPIVTRYNGPAIYVDGFAGPGKYKGGELGSPIIAIEAWRNRPDKNKAQDVSFIFIEERQDRANHLQSLLTASYPEAKVQVHTARFFDTMTTMLDEREGSYRKPIPMFVFIDPFGISHTPMSIIHRIMKHEKCEVLITFMYEFVNRLTAIDYTGKETQYDELFGTPDWRTIITSTMDPDERKHRIYDLYYKQLQSVGGAQYIRSFRMDTARNQTEYFLFFGTNSLDGLRKMKTSMIAADPTKSYSFSDITGIAQIAMFTNYQPPVRNYLEQKFIGGPPVSVEEIDRFVLVETPYVNFKDDALVPMEREGAIEIVASPKGAARKKGSFTDGTVIRFLPPHPKLFE